MSTTRLTEELPNPEVQAIVEEKASSKIFLLTIRSWRVRIGRISKFRTGIIDFTLRCV